MASFAVTVLLAGSSAAFPAPRAAPAMAWNAWNTFSVNGKPMRGQCRHFPEASPRGMLHYLRPLSVIIGKIAPRIATTIAQR